MFEGSEKVRQLCMLCVMVGDAPEDQNDLLTAGYEAALDEEFTDIDMRLVFTQFFMLQQVEPSRKHFRHLDNALGLFKGFLPTRLGQGTTDIKDWLVFLGFVKLEGCMTFEWFLALKDLLDDTGWARIATSDWVNQDRYIQESLFQMGIFEVTETDRAWDLCTFLNQFWHADETNPDSLMVLRQNATGKAIESGIHFGGRASDEAAARFIERMIENDDPKDAMLFHWVTLGGYFSNGRTSIPFWLNFFGEQENQGRNMGAYLVWFHKVVLGGNWSGCVPSELENENAAAAVIRMRSEFPVFEFAKVAEGLRIPRDGEIV